MTADSDVLRIARDVIAVDREQVPHGIELLEMDGVKLDGLEQPIRYPWTAEGKVILNATARCRALP